MARAPALSEHCCWVCSTCPFGKVKPDCGGQGWLDGRTKRGLTSVVGHITRAVQAGASKHGLLFEPRGLLDDEDELETLAWGIIDQVLPTRVGMEECEKCCDVCRDKGLQQLKHVDILVQVINIACGPGTVSIPATPPQPRAATAAAAAAAAAIPAVPPSNSAPPTQGTKRGLGPARSANAPPPLTPPSTPIDDAEDEENQPPDDTAVQEQQKLKRQKHAVVQAKSELTQKHARLQAEHAILREQHTALQGQHTALRAEAEASRGFKTRARAAEARLAELEPGQAEVEMEAEGSAEITRLTGELEASQKICEELRRKADEWRTDLKGIKLNLKEVGHNKRSWTGEKPRMIAVDAHLSSSVPLDKTIQRLQRDLVGLGAEVKSGTSDKIGDGTDVTISGMTESMGQIKWQLAHDVANLFEGEFAVPSEKPSPPPGSSMEAHADCRTGPIETDSKDDWYRKFVFEPWSEWKDSSSDANAKTLCELPGNWEQMCKIEGAEAYINRMTPGGAPGPAGREWRKAKVKFVGCLGLTFMTDDTSKFNQRNMSAILIGGPGLTDEGEVRLLALHELFGAGGNTGDLDQILKELVSFRDWQRSIGVPETKLLYLYHFVSFCVDNCNGMTGPRAGLVAKVNQVRTVCCVVLLL
jgi:hypothetical protein